MMEKINITPKELRAIMRDYDYNPDIMNEEDDRVRLTKWAISQLPVADRVIINLYIDYQSSRKVGQILGVSHNVILAEVKRIKQNIHTILCS